MSIELTQRNATMADLVTGLEAQQLQKLDAVIPAQAIRSVGGTLVVAGMGLDGPVGEPGLFQPTAIMDGQIAARLGIPSEYLKRLRVGKTEKGKTVAGPRLDIYDANVNAWLHGDQMPMSDGAGPDGRSFLLRSFTDQDGGVGVGRALLSDRFGVIDNLDMTAAVFQGIRDTGIDVEVQGCDVSETRMTVKIVAPSIQIMAEKLLEGYRSPFSGKEGKDMPVVFAGLVFTNSETGGGAYQVIPRFVVEICSNGMTMKRDALREVHIGSKLEEGVIRWTRETHQQNLELVAAKTRDAVATFLDEDYMTMVVDRLTEKAATPITDPAKAVELIGSQLRYTEEQRAGILDHFIKGGQVTAGGFMQAVTSFAQTVADPDASFELEMSAMDALELAVA